MLKVSIGPHVSPCLSLGCQVLFIEYEITSALDAWKYSLISSNRSSICSVTSSGHIHHSPDIRHQSGIASALFFPVHDRELEVAHVTRNLRTSQCFSVIVQEPGPAKKG